MTSPVYRNLEKEAFCRHSTKPAPHWAWEKPHEWLLPNRSQTTIWKSDSVCETQMYGWECFTRIIPGCSYSVTTVFITREVNSYWQLTAPDPQCVGGCRALRKCTDQLFEVHLRGEKRVPVLTRRKCWSSSAAQLIRSLWRTTREGEGEG